MPNTGLTLSPDDWGYLNSGDRVVLQRPKEIPRPGTGLPRLLLSRGLRPL
jgi:hypothetical protein